MKKILFMALAIIASATFTTANAAKKDKKNKKETAPVETVSLKTSTDSLSYAAGMARTEGLLPYLKQSFNVEEKDMADFVRGFQEAVKQGTSDQLNAYACGMLIAHMVDNRMIPYLKEEFKTSGDSIDTKLFNHGFLASLKKDNSLMTDSLGKAYFDKTVKDNIERINKKNKLAGESFLASNAKKEGVVTTESGLQYKVITQGTGEKPKATDRVVVKYEGKTLDGKVFDSSYKRNPQTATFGVSQVIKGWTEALQLMPVGSKWEVYIPYNLAYGERGAGRNIKPYDALIFTVELVDIEKPKAKDETKTATKTTKTATAAKKFLTSKKK